MAEARKTHQRHMAGVAMGMLLKPSKGVRDDIIRSGGKPKDHMKENVKLLRNLQLKNKEKEEEKLKSQPSPFKLKKFENIPSRVLSKRLPDEVNSNESRPESADSTVKKKNYIALNAHSVCSSKPSSGVSTPTQSRRQTPPGQIPKYLIDRKLQWAKQEEERIMALENNKIPKGMLLLSENERIRTLNALKVTKEELLDELSRFPMIVELPSLKQRKMKIEAQLNETDSAIGIFSRPKVFVPKAEFERLTTDDEETR